MRKFIYLVIFIFSLAFAEAIEPKDYSILTDVQIDTSQKLKITINWLADSNAKVYEIRRKLIDEDDWGEPIAILDSNALSYTDSTIHSGLAYEYFLYKKIYYDTDSSTEILDGYNYIAAGYDVQIPHNRGRLLLLIDSTMTDALKFEIDRFIYDITGDGWNVVRHNVPRTEQFNKDEVLKIKEIIVNEFNNHPDSLTGIVILGRVAVPYSGDFAIDGHDYEPPYHKGAWVADTYYADIDGVWTDSTVYDTIATRIENKNIPGDGKFDQNQIPTDVDLFLGRIDFNNITYYNIPEVELIRHYLNKDHDFRHGIFKPDYNSIINDDLKMYEGIFGEVFSSNAWSNFSALLGTSNVSEGKFVMPGNSPPKIWAYGCGSGNYHSIQNTIYLDRLDTANTGGIFGMLFGSFNGDWDVEDNILRAYLAYAPYALTVSWSGRPFWQFHHMALGLPIGYSTKLSQNSSSLYETTGKFGHRYVHVNLLGDPTLRMYAEDTPYNIQVSSIITTEFAKVNLTWNSNDTNLLGFNIYRSNDIYNKFEKLNNELISDSSFTDYIPLTGKNIYMIRAVRKRETATGMFVNMSQGVFAETDIPKLEYYGLIKSSFKFYPNPANEILKTTFILTKEESVKLSVWDVSGKQVKTIISRRLKPGYYSFNWDLSYDDGSKVYSGVYFLRIETDSKTLLGNIRVLY